jgi:alpha-L-rhamnosidase
MQIGDLGVWLYEYLGGIRPDPENPGFKHILIRPYMVKGLSSVKTSHRSMYGLIASHWTTDGHKVTLEATIPANTTATIWVPASHANRVTENGKAASSAQGVTFVRMQDDAAVYEVQSGAYKFGSDLE